MGKKALTHTCIICGERYASCDNCEQIKTYTPWRTLCDTHEHYRVYLEIRAYQEGYDVAHIQEELKKLGVTNESIMNWPEGTRKLLQEIMAAGKQTEKKIEKKTADKAE